MTEPIERSESTSYIFACCQLPQLQLENAPPSGKVYYSRSPRCVSVYQGASCGRIAPTQFYRWPLLSLIEVTACVTSFIGQYLSVLTTVRYRMWTSSSQLFNASMSPRPSPLIPHSPPPPPPRRSVTTRPVASTRELVLPMARPPVRVHP
jgi:hypothetical protein